MNSSLFHDIIISLPFQYHFINYFGGSRPIFGREKSNLFEIDRLSLFDGMGDPDDLVCLGREQMT
jgi:hypothetical protein